LIEILKKNFSEFAILIARLQPPFRGNYQQKRIFWWAAWSTFKWPMSAAYFLPDDLLVLSSTFYKCLEKHRPLMPIMCFSKGLLHTF